MDDSAMTIQLSYHIHRARVGRRRLANVTALPEMGVRTELERLRSRGFVRWDRSGVTLTPSGRRHFAVALHAIHDVRAVELETLQLGFTSLAAHVTVPARHPVWALRDVAVRGGATALILLRWEGSGWLFAHNAEPVAKRNAADAETLASRFAGAEPGDLLVIAFGLDRRSAGLGLWRALTALLETKAQASA